MVNIYVMDGFLDSLPLPDNSADFLMTSNAIGWNLEDELTEIERVVKHDGKAIHLMRTIGNKDKSPIHDVLVSSKCGYTFTSNESKEGVKYRYVKSIS
jgi:ubiquinone/menaquinone biosynthesis C-methylase UbiE